MLRKNFPGRKKRRQHEASSRRADDRDMQPKPRLQFSRLNELAQDIEDITAMSSSAALVAK